MVVMLKTFPHRYARNLLSKPSSRNPQAALMGTFLQDSLDAQKSADENSLTTKSVGLVE